jgi:hypothetical protein
MALPGRSFGLLFNKAGTGHLAVGFQNRIWMADLLVRLRLRVS